ncbi:MAG: YraN family protein [Anaerolineaceae bacterium]
MKNDHYRQYIGRWGEDQAALYIVNNGLEVLEKNYRVAEGEIDLIAKENDILVFIEVKTRTSGDFGFPEEAITEKKLEHIHEVVEKYLASHSENSNWRIDVIAIQGKPGSKDIQIEWFKDAG